MNIPEDRHYTAQHEWLRRDGESAVIGITDHAQAELGDVVYLELPEVGSAIVQGESFGVIESVKAAGDLYAPVSGEVTAVNEALEAAPQLVNESPYDDGWLIRIRPGSFADEQSGLLGAEAYAGLLS